MYSYRPNAATLLPAFLMLSLGLSLVGASRCDGADVTVQGRRYTLPDGFELSLAAGSPLVERPISADFDEQGRLYVTESSGTNDDVQTQLMQKPHRILRLTDTDGDGQFDERTVFADGLMFPEGALWHDGSFYVAAPPEIWKFTDEDDDGVADRREVWFDGKTLTGCANDLHGPYLGRDGWIYWCKGAFAEQTHELTNGKTLVTRAAHVFRRHPDGGNLEHVMTGGMDNPVEVVFTPGGERIFTTTFLQRPAGGRRDGLIHAIYGGVYGKVNSAVDGHPRTSAELMPALTHLGAAAPCGLAYMESDQLGGDFQGSLLACLFNMQKVSRHTLSTDGATFTTMDSDLLVSDDLDFHPTDVVEDADGSLLVVDTGGWYKLCCPTSQLWKPDVHGAIYRIRRSDAQPVDDPRGEQIDWDETPPADLAALLKDRRPLVCRRAIECLAKRGEPAVEVLDPLLLSSDDAGQRRRAVWTLTRINAPPARAAVRRALVDADPIVRQAAIHSVSLWRDQEALATLCEMLSTGTAHNRRAAAEALGRIGDSAAIEPLLTAASEPTDRTLRHSLTYALIEIGDTSRLRAHLTDSREMARCAATVALDQLDAGALRPDDVADWLAVDNGELEETAWWIATRHPEWGDQMADFFVRRLGDGALEDDDLQRLTGRLQAFTGDANVQRAMAHIASATAVRPAVVEAVFAAMASSNLEQPPQEWQDVWHHALAQKNSQLADAAVTSLLSFDQWQPSPELAAQLRRLADDPDNDPSLRLSALIAVASQQTLDNASFDLAVSNISADVDPAVRSLAVRLLEESSLTPAQWGAVAVALPNAVPGDFRALLELFKETSDPEVGSRLVAALWKSPTTVTLSPDALAEQLAAYGVDLDDDVRRLVAHVQSSREDQFRQVDDVLATVESGDTRRGLKVFKSTKAACFTCHALGYLGGSVGPDLSHIGRIRSDRDLVEAILFPSASFVRSYEPVTIATSDGKVVNGLLRDETKDFVEITIDAERTVRVAKTDIEERAAGTVSVMPTGFGQQLTPQEIADLIAFLRNNK
ncbi:MAG: HEAT repeat domain-containing protein [Pirellulales bacterium]